MARYLNEADAAAAGFTITHEPDRSRYVITASGPDGGRVVGEAHYALRGNDVIDFDHTVVAPELRGNGLSGLLARRAVTGEAVGERRIEASCWFIDGYLQRHPELLAAQADSADSGESAS
ncbi:GNAT family N-acetyltransferase [Leucobacter sp. NPDC058333]|uniref:GNAT family N-acetyltransferase n=1 Tax=Leucobacter sp. NPDC058333 TaxID=3346450 RepID=UPI003655E569